MAGDILGLADGANPLARADGNLSHNAALASAHPGS
jgi:hypothetical protein